MRAARAAGYFGFLMLVLSGCAHIEPPTGGPPDRTAPRLLLTRPDTLSVVPTWNGAVTFVFSERISEQRVEEAVMVSPRTSPVEVSHRGDQIRVDLRRGWQPGVIYHVLIQRVIQDLFNNRLAEPVALVFSTGPEIPNTATSGVVIDRITARPDTSVRVEAIRRADSLVYAAPVDSAGGFTIAKIPEGDYLLRAYRDLNRNRALDPFEASDTSSATVAIGDTSRVSLSVVLPDTTPPRTASAALAAEGRVEVKFDDYLDPAQEIAPANVRIIAPDSTLVAVAAVRVGTGAAATDTAAVPPAAQPVTPRLPPFVAAPGRPGPLGPVPAQTLSIDLASEARLAPATRYLIRIVGVRNVVGLSGDAEVELTTPAPPPPAPPPTSPAPEGGGAN